MEDLGLVGDLAIVAAAAVAGGAVARALRLPTVLGYLLAGIAIGPHTPGPSGDISDVGTVADLGVALLMFTLGIQFSLKDLNELKGIGITGGVLGSLALASTAAALAMAFGMDTEPALIVGMATSISSSMVALKLLEERGLIGAAPGRVTIAISLVQDMTVVVMLTLIPVIGGDEGTLLEDLLLAIVKAAALLAGIWLIGNYVLPAVLGRIAVSRSRELFLLTVVALALGTASVSAEAGLSLAFGAFIAGILLSESEYAHRTLVEVLPLREVFAVVFFVAIGMLFDPASFSDEPELIALVVALGVFLRIGVIGGVAVLFRQPVRIALAAGVALASVGEFSFVIASEALGEGIITPQQNEALVAAVLISIASAPLLFMVHEHVLQVARAAPILAEVLRPRSDSYFPEGTRLVNHAVIVGYTQAGREVATALALRDFKYVVIDEDPQVFRRLSGAGVPVILGNAALPPIMEQAAIDRAFVLVVTVSDPGQIESVAATARGLNRRLDIVARGMTEDALVRLRNLGVARIVLAEFEVGMQFVRHTLQRFGMTSQEVQALLLRLRRERLGEAGPDRR